MAETMKIISLEQLKGIMRARVDEAPSLRQAAKALGLSPATVSYFLLYADEARPAVLKALGYRAVKSYTKVKT